MTFIIPTPEQFADPNSEFNNPIVVQEDVVESLIKKIFELYKKSSSIMYSDLKCAYDIWKQAAEKISAQGWHIGLKKFPDEPMGSFMSPGFSVVCIESQTKMTAAEFAQSLIVVEEVAS